jgi:uncharacterized protein (DUF2147 family)
LIPIGGLVICLAIAFAIDAGSVARELSPAAPLGRWATANGGGVIEIGWCGETLCGRIVGIPRSPGEAIPTDYQGRSQCGLTILTDAGPTGDDTWLGHITDPRNGKEYQAELWVDDAGRLKLRGFVGVPLFGKTVTWDRFAGRLTADCRVL